MADQSLPHVVEEGDDQGEEYKDILQEFQTEDGGTIVLSQEQIAQMQQVMYKNSK